MATRERAGSRRHVRAYVGLGANLGDPAGTLAAGIHALAALPGVLEGFPRHLEQQALLGIQTPRLAR